MKNLWQTIKWTLRGRPIKKVTGGWCGCCGDWIADAKFTFRDYHVVDNLFDLNTLCKKCIEGCGKKVAHECL